MIDYININPSTLTYPPLTLINVFCTELPCHFYVICFVFLFPLDPLDLTWANSVDIIVNLLTGSYATTL